MDYLYSLTTDFSIGAFHLVRNRGWGESGEISVNDMEKAISTVSSWYEK